MIGHSSADTRHQRRPLGPFQLVAVQDLVAPRSCAGGKLLDALQNRLAGRQFHLAAHRLEVELRIGQRAVEIEDDAGDHAHGLSAKQAADPGKVVRR